MVRLFEKLIVIIIDSSMVPDVIWFFFNCFGSEKDFGGGFM
jgi:hypothetical protein